MADDPLHSGSPLDYEPPQKDSVSNLNNIRAYQRNIAIIFLLYIIINGKLTDDWAQTIYTAFVTGLGVIVMTAILVAISYVIGRLFKREHRWAIGFTQLLVLSVLYLASLLQYVWF